MLNNFNILLLNTNSILFTSCVKISEQFLVFMHNTAYLIRKGQNRKSQKSNLGSIMCFSEVILISCVLLNNNQSTESTGGDGCIEAFK